ncbi:MAG: AI-2E family transporter [Turicibacter sp.]
MDQFKKYQSKFLIGLIFVACGYIIIKLIDNYHVFFQFTRTLFTTLFPFILAFVLAYLLNPIVMFFENKFKVKRGYSVTLTFLTILLLLYISISYIWPLIYSNASDLVKQTPFIVSEFQEWINGLGSKIDFLDLTFIEDIKSNLMSFVPKLTELLTSSVSSLVSVTVNIVSVTSNFILACIMSIYILLEKEKFLSMSTKLTYIVFRPKYSKYIFESVNLFHVNIGKYLIGKSMDSIFVGICAIIGLAIIKAQYAVLLGVVFGITNMVPFVGPIFGTAIAVIINVFYSPMTAIVILIFLIVVQQIETLVIDPKVVGQQMGLNPFFTILAVTIGGQFFGIPGMILGVPIMGVIKLYAQTFINSEFIKIVKKEQPLVSGQPKDQLTKK